MTFQSLSALPLGSGTSSVAKSQENGPVRPERPGQTGVDFSALLNQAIRSKDWSAAMGQQRQGLADSGSRPAGGPSLASLDVTATPDGARTAAASRTTDSSVASRAGQAGSSGTQSELTQRALRHASLRAAQQRADGMSSARTPQGEAKTRRAASRRDDDAHAASSAAQQQTLPPNLAHRPDQDVTPANRQDAGYDTAVETARWDTEASQLSSLGELNASAASSQQTTVGLAAGMTPGSTPAGAGLTTVQLSPHLQILTAGQGVVNEQSLQAFAQSMGIDAQQFKQLVAAAPASSVDASGLRAGVTATDALTGTPILPPAPTDSTSIDLSQLLPAGMTLEDLQIAGLGSRRSGAIDGNSLSTLEVLGMREGALGADAVSSLLESSDAGAGGQQPDGQSGMGQPHLGSTARAGGLSASNGAHATAPQNMAEHFEKLSAKLATEMAGRIHEQFSQGEWKMKFALKPASLGQVDVQLEMRDGKLAAVLQADNPMTQDLLQNGSQRLRDALSQMGLSQSSVSVGDGRSQAFQGDRHPGAHGSAMATAQHQDSPDESVTTAVASAPRRDGLSQLDFYA